ASPSGGGGTRSVTERAVPLGILPSHPPTAGALPKGEPFLFVNLMTLELLALFLKLFYEKFLFLLN
ncbi:MAG: hypothetical protein J6D11_07810, partial [Clostridia bacterium]|nr:hypothetical protein [Clostridia bacterium]